jgi:hypothetical protein
MKTVLPRALVPTDVSHDDYDPGARMTPGQKTAYLELLINGASQHMAVKRLGIKRLLVVRETAMDEQFCADLNLALQARVDAIEELAIHFATRGTTEEVYHQGLVVGEKRNYGAHALLQFLLKGNKPERYKERSEQTLNVQRNEPPPAVRNDSDAQRLLARMRTELQPAIDAQFTELPALPPPATDGSDLI